MANDNLEIPRTIIIKRITWLDEMFIDTKDEKYKARSGELKRLLEYYGGDDD